MATLNTYFRNKIATLEDELCVKDREATTFIAEAEWKALVSKASSQLVKSRKEFADSMYWSVMRGLYAGRATGKMASEVKTQFTKYGQLRLLAEVPGSKGCALAFPALNSKHYEYLPIAGFDGRDTTDPARLGLDLEGRPHISICHMGAVDVRTAISMATPDDTKRVNAQPAIERALIREEKRLRELLVEFQQTANRLIRKDHSHDERADLFARITLLKNLRDGLQRVHLPAEHLIEIAETLELLLANRPVTAYLLRGLPGVGKTFLVQSAAKAAGIRLVQGGVNTLKQSSLGASASAVRVLWADVRRMRSSRSADRATQTRFRRRSQMLSWLSGPGQKLEFGSLEPQVVRM